MVASTMTEPSDQKLPSPTVASDDSVPQPVTWSRKLLALLIAVAADAPPLALIGESFPLIFDVGIASLLWLVLGRSRLLAMALLIECIPGVGLAPTWSLYVLWEIIASKTARGSQKTASPLIDQRPP